MKYAINRHINKTSQLHAVDSLTSLNLVIYLVFTTVLQNYEQAVFVIQLGHLSSMAVVFA